MGAKVCLKCDFENQNFEGTPMEACPNCGVIYEKYERMLEHKFEQKLEQEAKERQQMIDEEASKIALRKANEEALKLAKMKEQEEDARYAEILAEEKRIAAAKRKALYDKIRRVPLIAKIFFGLAFLSVISGVILAHEFHPGAPPRGHEWPSEAYFLTGFWLAAGFVQAALYAAIGTGLSYLDEISRNLAKVLEKGK